MVYSGDGDCTFGNSHVRARKNIKFLQNYISAGHFGSTFFREVAR